MGIFSDPNRNGTPADVLIRNNILYVANPDGVAGSLIIQVNPDTMIYIAGYGTPTTDSADLTPGNFFGPQYFVRRPDDGMVIINEWSGFIKGPFAIDRLLAMDNLDYANWQQHGTHGTSGNGVFDFFHPLMLAK